MTGAPLDTGFATLVAREHPDLAGGVYNLAYVPSNLVAYFFSFPHVIFNGPFDRHPALDLLNTGVVYQGFDGGVACSVFITTPLFLLLFTRNRRFNPLRAALWVTLGLFLAALLPFYSTGAYQFGARLLYDAYAYAFLLLALSDVRVDWRFAVLGLLGFAINVLGALQVWTDVMLHI